jgi:lysophospholipase L1-like esterase
MGDSITEFWSRFDPELFGEGVVNRGISGQTSPQMLVRFYSDVVALRPAAVHLMAGTNDLAGNTGPSRPEDFKNNIRAMVDLAEANGIAVVLASIPPAAAFPWRPEVEPAPIIAQLNDWLEGYATENKLVFVDYHAAITGPSGELRAELSSDGVHPDADGYAAMRPLTIEALAAAGVALHE